MRRENKRHTSSKMFPEKHWEISILLLCIFREAACATAHRHVAWKNVSRGKLNAGFKGASSEVLPHYCQTLFSYQHQVHGLNLRKFECVLKAFTENNVQKEKSRIHSSIWPYITEIPSSTHPVSFLVHLGNLSAPLRNGTDDFVMLWQLHWLG